HRVHDQALWHKAFEIIFSHRRRSPNRVCVKLGGNCTKSESDPMFGADPQVTGPRAQRCRAARAMNGRTPATAFVDSLPQTPTQKEGEKPEKRPAKHAA
ncbi:MAG: hypothetical protein ACLQIQ_08355, partial [Beijerinckiaceae bacterium]